MPVLGTCRLCLTPNADLQDSHILPRWAYRRIREPHLANPNPVSARNGVAVQTSTEIKEHLLCVECEGRLCDDEDYVARITVSEPGSLPELSGLVGTLRWRHDDLVVAPTRLLDLAAFIRFGIGVIWKGHECSKVPDCNLGPTISEAFRRHLLLGTPLPKNVSLTVAYLECAHVEKRERGLLSLMFTPQTSKRPGYFEHTFVIAGLRFLCNAGMRIDEAFQQTCLIHSETKGLYIVPKEYWAAIGFRLKSAVPKGSLAKSKKSWAAGGKVQT
jgi:hypothetical protein